VTRASGVAGRRRPGRTRTSGNGDASAPAASLHPAHAV